ncbi:MAG: ATP-binding protein, partial [Gemmatimonadaceae bacterium]
MKLKASVRFRLTLWNAAILALLLGGFAYASRVALRSVLDGRRDTEVRESAQAIVKTILTERTRARSRGEDPRPEVARDALSRLRAGDLDVYIVDEASRVVAASRSTVRHLARPATSAKPELASNKPTPSVPAGRDTVQTLPQHVRELLSEAKPSPEPQLSSTKLDGLSYRAAVLRVAPGAGADEPAMAVAVLRSGEEDMALEQRYTRLILFAIPLALLFSILCGYAIARRSLAPVEAMAEQAARISAATLDERLPVANEHDELGRLATVVNALLERVHVAFLQQRQFVADASHELRTPIAIVRGEADVTLQRKSREEGEYREALGIISEESVRLTRIVDDLFLLARTDAGAPVAQLAKVDLRELTVGALRSVRTIADDHDITLEQNVPDDAMCIEGDAPLLRRLLLNLLDNALKFTPRGGTVGISVQRMAHSVDIVVYDTGPGVPEGLRTRMFDRFVRASPDERPATWNESPRASSGAGLGLAIAAAIATAHHGTITLDDQHDSTGNGTGNSVNGVQKVEMFVDGGATAIPAAPVAGVANQYEAAYTISS